jgi:hypothetical protein
MMCPVHTPQSGLMDFSFCFLWKSQKDRNIWAKISVSSAKDLYSYIKISILLSIFSCWVLSNTPRLVPTLNSPVPSLTLQSYPTVLLHSYFLQLLSFFLIWIREGCSCFSLCPFKIIFHICSYLPISILKKTNFKLTSIIKMHCI